jgi:uncharacterized protein YyaL (SSP411 family)
MANRLSTESSPYLLQHSENPVDWYPWGPEALDRARREDRPILLSIGYSACHWCHVMERESFEDPSIAAAMNEAFVNVKVDREERPDVDQVYMRAVQALTGQGGWPLTVFLTPGGSPYYGGTYFPPEPRHGLPSFRQVLEASARAYRDGPDRVRQGAAELRAALEKGGQEPTPEGTVLGPGLLDEAARILARQFDPANGGFGSAPKFPQPVTIELLLRQHVRTGAPEPLDMAVHTLRRMAAGGIRDHLGGGFHRYAVDAGWLVPHFEKMLYDNALLARAYLDGYRISGEGDLRGVCEDILDYLLADMRSEEGAFFSARDADSEGEEGIFYVWTPKQVRDVLDAETAALFMRVYDVTDGGNFEGRNILHLPYSLDAQAAREGLAVEELERRLQEARDGLVRARSKRTPPMRDEKVLAGWNGMALRALAEAGGALGREDYTSAAVQGADFILTKIRLDGRLQHTYKDGQARVHGFLEDHGALGNALLSLHQTTLDPRWLPELRWCCEEIVTRFWDEESRAFFDAPRDAEPLFMRARDPMDNATPSGNSLAAELLLRAGHLFGENRYDEIARRALLGEVGSMRRYPTAFGRGLSVLDQSLAPPVELAIVGDRADPRTAEMRAVGLGGFHRNLTVTGRGPGEAVSGVPVLEGRDEVNQRPTAYLCRRYECRLPVTDAAALEAQLHQTDP